MKSLHRLAICAILLALFVHLAAILVLAQSQATVSNLKGVIKDESGQAIQGANVLLKNAQRNFERTTSTDEKGTFKFLSIPPGTYQLMVTANGFTSLINSDVILTLGQDGELNLILKAASSDSILQDESTDALESIEVIEISKTAVTQNIDSLRIENLPINGRNFLNFTLTNSQVNRDNSALIGSAPNTGLNFNGQAARSNLVQIDGADNIDNSINAARATISQEAVQEFQVIINSFSAQFGRTAGGVVNIVTKSGTNDFHGNVFGFIRHRSIQARNALAFQPDGSQEKPAFTRGQYGFTLGGPIKKDKTFFFLSLEQTRRQESGFSTIGLDATSFDLTSAQRAYIAANADNLSGQIYSQLATSGAGVAKTGIDPITGRPIFFSSLSAFGLTVPIPAPFRVLSNVENIYPIREKFSFYSARLDQQLTANTNLVLRYNFTPITTTGIQSTSQNQQILGLNDVSRTGTANSRDTTLIVQLVQALDSNKINEFLFNFGRRGTSFTSTPNVALNIAGTAFFGSDPLSPVDRIEKRYQFKDNFTFARNSHTFDFGADINIVRLSPVRAEPFFAGRFDFGEFDLSLTNPLFANSPPLTPVQAYGLGIPQVYIQSFGRSVSKVINKTFGFYLQDSWRLRPNITINYGLRYDVELTPTYQPVGITTDQLSLSAEQIDAAEKFLNVMQGIPRDKNNFAPRLAIAWSPDSDRKTVIRAAYGIFFDHPPLFFAFLSDVIDGVQSPQFIAVGGLPLPNQPLNASQIFQGTLLAGVTPGLDRNSLYLRDQLRFDPRAPFPGYGSILPTTLPISRDFVYGYTNQINFSIERELRKDLTISATYLFTGGRKLPRTRDLNAPNTKLVAATGGLTGSALPNNFFRPSGPNPLFIKTDRPIPFGTVTALESSASSIYHAFSLNLTKRFSNNFQTLVSYTFSKTIDYMTEFITPQDNFSPGNDRGLSDLDQRHRLVLSAVIKSPYKQSNTGIKRLLADFIISPIVEISSGRPFNILSGVDTNFDFSSTDRPNLDVSTGRLLLPALGETGTLGRNAGLTPGYTSIDLRLARTLAMGERLKLSFIGEVFNLFNRVNVSAVNSNFRFTKFSDGAYRSTATAVFDPRQFQFAVKLAF
ncbi:MAG: TonB-dependent receptor [Acidobacteriota bacterium]